MSDWLIWAAFFALCVASLPVAWRLSGSPSDVRRPDEEAFGRGAETTQDPPGQPSGDAFEPVSVEQPLDPSA